MRAPELTYRYIYPRDVAGPTFELLYRVGSVTAAALMVEINVTGIPENRILVVQNISMEAQPGLAQAVTDIQFRGVTQARLDAHLMHQSFVAAANQTRTAVWVGEAYLLGRGEGNNTLRLQAFFDAGAVANVGTVAVYGIVIPRGNASAF